MKLLFAYLLAAGLLTCSEERQYYNTPAECPVEATVIDNTGLDGCGLMLELKDGRQLNPQRLVYIQAPSPEQDPIYHFNLVAGEKVYIGYREAEGATTCMAGELVFITCIRSANQE
jgi:hypothetical protein